MLRRTFLSAVAGGFLGLVPARRAVAAPTVSPVPDYSGLAAAPAPAAAGERAIHYSRSKQRVSVLDADGSLIKSYFVSGNYGIPGAGSYRVYSKSPTAFSSKNPAVQWKYMVRFTKSPRGNPIGFHQIPVRCVNGKCSSVQGPGQVGTALSAGCVRQQPKHAKWLYGWAELGTLVVVTN